jgi:hypothetical protein
MADKRSHHELKRLVEAAVADVCGLPRPGLWFCVDEVEAHGHPPGRLRVWATLHFLPAGSPFCCGQTGCHLGLHGESDAEVNEHVRRAMGLRQPVVVEFGERIGVRYHEGVLFDYGRGLRRGREPGSR